MPSHIRLVSSEGHEVPLSRPAARLSAVLAGLLNCVDDADDDVEADEAAAEANAEAAGAAPEFALRVPVPEVRAHVLSRVVEFLERHAAERSTDAAIPAKAAKASRAASPARAANAANAAIPGKSSASAAIPAKASASAASPAKAASAANASAASAANARADALAAWDAAFIRSVCGSSGVDPLMCDIMNAANYLDAECLLDACCRAVADLVRVRNPVEIRRLFRIDDDLAPAEKAAADADLRALEN